MAVVIKGESRKGGAGIRKDGNNVVISERYEYIVLAAKTDSRMDVITAAGLPIVNYTTLASGARCTSKQADREEKQPTLWRVVCEFETTPPDQDEDSEDPSPDPTTWIPRWRGTVNTYTDYSERDKDDEAIVNSAGDRFSRGLAVTRSLVVQEFSQYEALPLTVDEIADRNELINSGALRGYAAKKILIHVRGFEYGWFYGVDCVRIDYTATYNPRGWEEKRLDIGPSYLESGSKKRYLDSAGYPSEVKLDGSTGAKSTDGSHFLTFQRYESDALTFLRTA